MTKEEFEKRLKEDEDFAPGWDAIEDAFKKVYGDQNPKHYGTVITSRAIFGGNEYLDGYSIYTSKNDYKHIVTFGMTELYGELESFGKEWSKWGYEMTIKLNEEKEEDCMWAINMLGNYARYTYTSNDYFEPYHYTGNQGASLHVGVDSKITAIMFVPDTEIESVDTVYGKVEFLQLVGITEEEYQCIKTNPEKRFELIELMKKDNPYLVTDMKRVNSYIK